VAYDAIVTRTIFLNRTTAACRGIIRRADMLLTADRPDHPDKALGTLIVSQDPEHADCCN
jgi:hypothetical protein